MGKLTLRQAARWCGGFVEEKYANVEFLGASNDTRVIQPGQLFVVLEAARDGHDFIPAAIEKGAAAVLCRRRWETILPSSWMIPGSLWERSPIRS